MASEVRTRIAPSPTGNLHVGTARAALFSELYARHHEGKFIVRIEDTDKERSKPEFEENILAGMKWLGLTWDEGPDIGGEYGPYRQSERTTIYAEAIEKLLASGSAYTETEDSEVVWLSAGTDDVRYTDIVRGEVSINPETWGGDFVIARSKTDPVFHLALVVDDHAMKISHVTRGEDHVVNTARHVLIQRALGIESPQYAHLPLLLDEERRKLSKRAGDTDLLAYKDKAIIPEAMLNYLALLGWSPKTDEEIFTHEELIERFDLTNVQKAGAIFSLRKLISVNRAYVKHQNPAQLLTDATPFLTAANYDLSDTAYWKTAVILEQDRLDSAAELPGLLTYMKPEWGAEYDATQLIWKKSDQAATSDRLERLTELLATLTESEFTAATLEKKLLSWIDAGELGRADTLWPMRVALTGKDKSPSQFDVAAALGQETTLVRLGIAIKKLQTS